MSDTTALLPTLNEAVTVADVVDGLRDEGFDDVLVMDGGSTDGTPQLARDAGAHVEVQTGAGKGQAVREAMRDHIDAEYVVMLDADGTYDPADAHRLLNPLRAGEANHAIGERLDASNASAWPPHRYLGNLAFEAMFEFRRGERWDILSGYRAWTQDAWDAMGVDADGWGIETALAREALETSGVETAVVPVSYAPRPDGSESKLSPLVAVPEILSEM
ncbi:glycosyltransferase family 2 protein [Halorussus limi]|uniref:Glycosyltransferase family 2 protein n=1 Tax=Halorussus limi TaxID=2938695 RepID=A0A8U0HQM7_9EURY|nr:glycosyltransferase family 2 protein [Halorussus limi]UPV73188.1 glycosyltransferase family 2 protein [Halorussus limi]